MLVCSARPSTSSSSWCSSASRSTSRAPTRADGGSGSCSSGALWVALSALGVDVLVLPQVLSVVLGLLFVGNGLRLLRPQGRGLTNVLALLLGIAILTATAVGTGVVGSGAAGAIAAAPTGPEVLGIVVLLARLPGARLRQLRAYRLTYRRHRARAEPAAVVVLGSDGGRHGAAAARPPARRGRRRAGGQSATAATSASSCRAAGRATTSRCPRGWP